MHQRTATTALPPSPVVAFDQVTKYYQKKFGGVSGVLRALLHRPSADDVRALQDVTFELRAGDILGIIGPNGAGKSTILKILARVTRPSRGRVAVHGRVGALIELGAGFHPDLTARENIYLYGAISGMSRRAIRRQFDAIVGFAEIGEFLSTPVKFFSSGMVVRLGFAITVHAEPEILLIDEVLSVGDLRFQNKCLRKIHELRQRLRGAIVVSHNMDHVRRLCTRVLLLNRGVVVATGDADEVISKYHELSSELELTSRQSQLAGDLATRPGVMPPAINAVRLLVGGRASEEVPSGASARWEFTLTLPRPVARPLVFFSILNARSDICLWYKSSHPGGVRTAYRYRLTIDVANIALVNGVYDISLALRDADSGATIFRGRSFKPFRITGSQTNEGVLDARVQWDLAPLPSAATE